MDPLPLCAFLPGSANARTDSKDYNETLCLNLIILRLKRTTTTVTKQTWRWVLVPRESYQKTDLATEAVVGNSAKWIGGLHDVHLCNLHPGMALARTDRWARWASISRAKWRASKGLKTLYLGGHKGMLSQACTCTGRETKPLTTMVDRDRRSSSSKSFETHDMFLLAPKKMPMIQSSEDPDKPFIEPRHEPFPLSSRSLCYLFIPDFNKTDSFQQSSADTNNYLYEWNGMNWNEWCQLLS